MKQAMCKRTLLFSYNHARRGVKHGERSISNDRKKGEQNMAGIFTRKALTDILNNGDLTPEERADSIFSLYGRALDDGYVTKGAAQAAQDAAIKTAHEAWEKDHRCPGRDTDSDQYCSDDRTGDICRGDGKYSHI